MMIKIYTGNKAKSVFENGICYSHIWCDGNDDVDTVYDAFEDLIDFQYLKDDDVTSLLEDAEKHGFISDYVIYYWKNKQKWRLLLLILVQKTWDLQPHTIMQQFFYCEDHDVKTAYDIIADSIVFKDHAYRLVFELLGGDKDVKTFLEDAKEQGFISDYGMC